MHLIQYRYRILFSLILVTFFGAKIFSLQSNNSAKNEVELGRHLFYDTRLSYNLTKSCSSCHDPLYAFTDGYRTSSGAEGYNVKRNAPSLLNASFNKAFTWGDSTIRSFQDQIKLPLFNNHPKELGWNKYGDDILYRLRQIPLYQNLFAKAFPNKKNTFTEQNIIQAIIAFEEQLVSFDAPYDAYLRGNKNAMDTAAINGMQLFNSKKLACGSCHSWDHNLRYENTGLYNWQNKNSYPPEDQGLYSTTKNISDNGKFRVPSLRNILLTAPYAHDGSVATIQDIIAIYERGGRASTDSSFNGDGKNNQLKSILIKGFHLTSSERSALLSFFAAMTDTSYLQKSELLNPFNIQ